MAKNKLDDLIGKAAKPTKAAAKPAKAATKSAKAAAKPAKAATKSAKVSGSPRGRTVETFATQKDAEKAAKASTNKYAFVSKGRDGFHVSSKQTARRKGWALV